MNVSLSGPNMMHYNLHITIELYQTEDSGYWITYYTKYAI